MFGSKNRFFQQTKPQLNSARIKVQELLLIKGRTKKEIEEYLSAFDYFVSTPSDYDGATIVKDLVDVRTSKGYLDVDAMLHDYEYIKGANSNFVKKWKSDIKYIKNMEKNGKGIRVFRMFILTLSGIVFVPYKFLKGR